MFCIFGSFLLFTFDQSEAGRRCQGRALLVELLCDDAMLGAQKRAKRLSLLSRVLWLDRTIPWLASGGDNVRISNTLLKWMLRLCSALTQWCECLISVSVIESRRKNSDTDWSLMNGWCGCSCVRVLCSDISFCQNTISTHTGGYCNVNPCAQSWQFQLLYIYCLFFFFTTDVKEKKRSNSVYCIAAQKLNEWQKSNFLSPGEILLEKRPSGKSGEKEICLLNSFSQT